MRTTLILLAACALSTSIVIRAPMHKTASLRAQMIKEGTFTDFIAQQQLARLTSKGAVGKQPYADNYDDVYRGVISLGTPAQNFTVLVDTGSTDTWVIGSACSTPACNGDANSGYAKDHFDKSASSTFSLTSKNFAISGWCSGQVAEDVFTLAGLKQEKQSFGLASTVVDYFGFTPVDGVFGLAWPASSQLDVTPPLWNMLGQLDAPLFTIWLDRKAKSTEDSLGGLITYGALDTEHCDGQVDYVQLSSLTYWQYPMTKFSIGNYVSNTKVQVISQTAAWIGAPTSAVAGIASATGAKFDMTNYLYTLPCTGVYPDMIFTIGGRYYNVMIHRKLLSYQMQVPSSEYVLDLGLGGGKCALALYELGGGGFGPDWILGYTWLRTYCNMHDIGQKRIGFARARHSD
ncbi:hypothetical protein PMAYCL1PPCAC_20641 [Pristionchus mayeri]|uniref:Peptidase A1 domain-containing protein n=1 Tax=Pristionchus mayeri TaxID=1317129 RepID=A0AAN5I4F7_9BILA|nr:hypothetical protein PMAYCL1PPCAC_20641 [Pristionchus mayeri]